MKKTILTLLIALAIVACSKEEIKKMAGKVDVTLYLKDANGNALKNWTVYVYDQWAWEYKSSSRPTFYANLRKRIHPQKEGYKGKYFFHCNED